MWVFLLQIDFQHTNFDRRPCIKKVCPWTLAACIDIFLFPEQEESDFAEFEKAMDDRNPKENGTFNLNGSSLSL